MPVEQNQAGGTGPRPSAAPTELETIDQLTRVLAKTCRRLAEAGRPHEAGRLAADGWVLLRGQYPNQAQRLDGAMHYTARLEQRLEASGHSGDLPAWAASTNNRETGQAEPDQTSVDQVETDRTGVGSTGVNHVEPTNQT